MDYIKLANMLFPEELPTVEEILTCYPKRILPQKAQVTRVAPSPTGYLHIGTVYQAFINKLIAYHSGGVFFMRLEDTDCKREVQNAGDIAYNMLCYFGLKPDEGYRGNSEKQVGEYGDYIQSKRQNIYMAFAKHLVSIGKAYPCFCQVSGNKEDVLKRREEELAESDDIDGKDVCRNLTLEQVESNLSKGMPFAIRLKSEGNGEKKFKFKDEIKGEREIRENSKDIVILKSNKIPPYSLAHVVDDTLMGTTLVVRGEEWFPSLASHLELFHAFGLKPPKYAHTPVISKIDENGGKRKVSKRKDAEADARYFVEKGYPVGSVMEYLLNLINSDFEDFRRANPDKSYYEFPFKVSKIGSNNPMFDFQKLDDCSKQVIGRFSAQDIYNSLLAWAEKYDRSFYEKIVKMKDFCIKLFSIDREGKNPRKDISKWSEVENLYSYMFYTLDGKELIDYDFDCKNSPEEVISALKEYKKVFDINDDKQMWFDKIKSICPLLNFADNMKEYRQNPEKYRGNVADLSGLIRVAITTRRNTPDLYYIMQLLGKNEVEKRLDYAINLLSKKIQKI